MALTLLAGDAEKGGGITGAGSLGSEGLEPHIRHPDLGLTTGKTSPLSWFENEWGLPDEGCKKPRLCS